MGRPQQEVVRKNISYSFDPETILRIRKAAKKLKVPASRYVETVLLERLDREGKSK